jgi:hypothetical protein
MWGVGAYCTYYHIRHCVMWCTFQEEVKTYCTWSIQYVCTTISGACYHRLCRWECNCAYWSEISRPYYKASLWTLYNVLCKCSLFICHRSLPATPHFLWAICHSHSWYLACNGNGSRVGYSSWLTTSLICLKLSPYKHCQCDCPSTPCFTEAFVS